MLLAALSTVIGAFTGALPSIINIFDKRLEHKYAIELARINMEAAEKGAQLQISIAEAKADADEGDSVRRHDSGLRGNSFIESLRASVRPVITYIFFGMFVLIKGSAAYVMVKNGSDIPTMLTAIWDQETIAIFGAVIGFWFGSRTIEKFMGRDKQRIETVKTKK